MSSIQGGRHSLIPVTMAAMPQPTDQIKHTSMAATSLILSHTLDQSLSMTFASSIFPSPALAGQTSTSIGVV